MKATFYILSAWVLSLTLWNCDLINPDEPIPGYIVVQPFQITTNPFTQGSNSARITEVWASSGTDFIGVYSLPATIPVIAEGLQTVVLQAGIKDNGVGALPEIYPFYAPVSVQVDFQPNGTTTFSPVTSYLPETRFAFIEDFEGPEHIFRELRVGAPELAMQRSTESPFEGQASGLISLDSANNLVEIAAWPRFSNLNSNSPFVYLEMNYKSEVAMLVGLVGYVSGGPATGFTVYETGFFAREDWNKIYFNLSQVIFESRFDEYQIVIQAAIPIENGTPVRKTAKVWLDNVKLVHF
ncbi:MAG: hypothetical protein KF852_07720 [Saprospiraceae bacterium]|nr:hypothetical protein [Saprospiraceae bacterium]